MPDSPIPKCISALLFGSLIFWGCAAPTPEPVKIPADPEAAIRNTWDTVKKSTAKVWVDYSDDIETRGEVNFIKGTVDVETVLPVDTDHIPEEARRRIILQSLKILTAETPAHTPILKDQIRNRKGETVSESNAEPFVREEVASAIVMEDRAYAARDGVHRMKLKTRFRMTPAHVRIRAMQYLAAALRYADEYRLDPALVMAVIHAESHFNPMARSPDGALGLMQLIPRYGGREAFAFVHGGDESPAEAYYFDPEKNIELGTAYFHLLKTRHIDNVPDGLKKRYLTICAYNWGPTRIRRLLRSIRLEAFSDQGLYEHLLASTPQETAEYLKAVISLMPQYRRMVRKD